MWPLDAFRLGGSFRVLLVVIQIDHGLSIVHDG